MAESDTGETFAFDSVSFERKASDAAYSDMCGKVDITCAVGFVNCSVRVSQACLGRRVQGSKAGELMCNRTLRKQFTKPTVQVKSMQLGRVGHPKLFHSFCPPYFFQLQ